MDVELIEDEAHDALRIDAPELMAKKSRGKSSKVAKRVKAAKAKNDVQWINSDSDDETGEVIVISKEIPDNDVEWLDNSDDDGSWETEEEVDASVAESAGAKNKDNEQKDDTSDQPANNPLKSPEDRAMRSKLAGSKQILANALLRVAKKRSFEAKKHLLETMKCKKKWPIVPIYAKNVTKLEAPLTNSFVRTVKRKKEPQPELNEDDAVAKSKQEETIAKITERSSELTVKKLGGQQSSTKDSKTRHWVRVTASPAESEGVPVKPTENVIHVGSNVYSRVLPKPQQITNPKYPSTGYEHLRFVRKKPQIYKPSKKVLIPVSTVGPPAPDGKLQLQGIISNEASAEAKVYETQKLARADPICTSLNKPDSFLESYIRSKEMQGIFPDSKKVKPTQFQLRRMYETVVEPSRPTPGKIRVKSNAKLFNNFNEDLFTTAEDPQPTTSAVKIQEPARSSTPTHLVELRSIKEKSPEPEKYVIPQDMLMSSTEKAKVVERKPVKPEVNAAADYNFADMFVMDEPEGAKKIPDGALTFSGYLRHKRKSSLVTKDDDDIQFGEKRTKPLMKLVARPKENLDLIENLATYRVLVASLLKKLDLPPMDLNEDSNNFINTYKIYHN